MTSQKEPWFAKRGNGYGFKPNSKEGWIVVGVYLLISLVSAACYIYPALQCSTKECMKIATQKNLLLFLLFQLFIGSALVYIMNKRSN